MNQNNKLLELVKSDQYLKKIRNKRVKIDLRNKILNCYDKRVFNKFTRKDISKSINVSESTVKRLENGKVYDISIIYNYINLLKDLPNKKKIEVPKWVYN